jgi:aquaporin rerated protein, other eukaryote
MARNRHSKFSFVEPIMGFRRDSARVDSVAFLAEFTGTFLFLFFALASAQAANSLVTSDSDVGLSAIRLFYIAAAFGCSVAINVWLFYRVSGGMFNPAVGKALSRRRP